MVIREVNLRFDRSKGYIAVFVCSVVIFLFLGLVIGLKDSYPACLLFFLFLLVAGGRIARSIARRIDGDPVTSFPQMYGELFARPPVQINYRFDTEYYLTAICYDGEFLYIIEKNRMVTLKWSDVRQWEWVIVTPQKQTTMGSTPGLAVQGMMNDAIANAAPALKAVKDSGIRLSVKDINDPQWFFNTGNKSEAEAVCRKWAEIFQQFTDGAIKIAH
jgi:hypothetical protein